MSLSSVGEKFELCLTSTYLLELFVAEYIREININFYLSLMSLCTSCIEKVFEEKKREIEKEIVEGFIYASVVERIQESN